MRKGRGENFALFVNYFLRMPSDGTRKSGTDEQQGAWDEPKSTKISLTFLL